MLHVSHSNSYRLLDNVVFISIYQHTLAQISIHLHILAYECAVLEARCSTRESLGHLI